ncbi:MAG: ATP-binding protein, partial [Deltaproteobacteria bacterium]|nr:ATP-binding protein [Deltaproteobacteria bacterium]
IADNSIAAKATHIHIHLDVSPAKEFHQKNSVERYVIADNGNGMDETQVTNALKLGSAAGYPDQSLSKYGLGLKSAGFS